MSEAHARSLNILQQAELKGQTDLNEAREEAMRVRNAASEEARTIHKDAVKKAEEYLVEIQAKYTRELAEQKTQMLEAARVEARNESERTISGLARAPRETSHTNKRSEIVARRD
jgi:F0F1-type ATP synthase membrane subunit b/b'